MTGYNELRNGQEFYGNGYKKGVSDMTDKIKQAVADEFKYRASQGRTNYSMEEVIYIVNEVIDEVNFEENEVIPEAQFIDIDVQMRIIKGDLRYLSEKIDKLSSFIEEQKTKR